SGRIARVGCTLIGGVVICRNRFGAAPGPFGEFVYRSVTVLPGFHSDAKEELVRLIDGLGRLPLADNLSLAGVGLKDTGFGIQPVDTGLREAQLKTLVGQEDGIAGGG